MTRFGLEMLIRQRAAGAPLDVDKIREAITTIAHYHAPLMNSSEVAWALWGAIAFDIALDERAIRLAVATGDPVVTILALDARARGLVDFDLAAELVAEIGTESLGSERWLMLYEAVRRGWLPDTVIQTDDVVPFFQRLSDDDVSFYNSEVELEKINRPLDELRGMTMPVVGFVFGY